MPSTKPRVENLDSFIIDALVRNEGTPEVYAFIRTFIENFDLTVMQRTHIEDIINQKA